MRRLGRPMNDLPTVLGIFGIGTTELVFLIILLVLLFGVNKIPDLARSLGRAQKEFQRAREDVEREGAPTETTEDERVRKAAQDLGLSVEGKSTDQLRDAIAQRMTAPRTPPT